MGSNLILLRSSVRVCYKLYHNTYKGIEIGSNDLSLEDAVKQELTPGKMKFYFKNLILKVGAIDINGGSHALVLDTVEKITQYNQSKGYDVGDHKLIFKNTYDDEENGKPKKFTINARSAKAPDVFFYVHIDVDLDAVPNYQEMAAEYGNRMKQLMPLIYSL